MKDEGRAKPQRARQLAEERSMAAASSHKASVPAVVFSHDGVFVEGEAAAGSGPGLAKCFAELATKVAAGERWLILPPWNSKLLGDARTMFTRRPEDPPRGLLPSCSSGEDT